MANRLQLRRGSAQEWANVNPTLAIGELGIELDTGRIKIGDGVSAWNSLKYERPLESITNSPSTLVQRDSDGNFQAGTITASVIGNSSTATRLANTRQIALTGDITASSTFDGSANLNLTTNLQIVPTLPHYDGTIYSTGTYTSVTVDAKGRITNASTPTNITAYGLNGTVEGSSAQGFDRDLQGIADLTTTGIITRVSDGNIATRSVAGTAGRISVTNGSGVSGNPTLDLINTTVVSATYNTPTVASATQTLNATKFTVDQWGRFTYAEDFPIATSVEGTTASAWSTSTSYSRYVKVTNAGRLYQALNTGTAGATAPTHTTGDASDGTVSWRHLGLVTTRQKGLASFDQEDFDVDSNGHVGIATAGVDNTQLQNNEIRFADGNSYTAYELDNELTSSTGYRGITTINNLSVNTTGGSPLLKCLAADDNVDINTTTSTIFSDITLDKTSTSIQTINRAGSLTLLMDANTSVNRFLRLTATNAGVGDARIEVSAENSVSIDSINSTLALTAAQQISLISSAADIRVEDFYFANNILSSTNSTIIIDPAGIGDNTGTVQIKGNLQIDGTTTTINSTTITIDDVILTLGGDQTPTTDDNKDRGIEFKYYDTEARLGFYGWDDSYTTLGGTTGGYRFLYNATNTSEVFTGTDAGIIAGNLALSSNVGSTSTTTGTLVITGGAGISQNLWVGGNTNVAGAVTFQSTLSITDDTTLNKNVTIVGSDTDATEFFRIQNGSGTNRFTVDSSSGNTLISGTLGVTGSALLSSTLGVTGATTLSSTLGVTGATTLSSTLGVTGATTLTGNLTTLSGSYLYSQNTDAPTLLQNPTTGVYEIQGGDYGSFRFDGGGYVNGTVLFNDDIYCNGALIVKDAGDTGVSSTVSNLAVRYRTTLGSLSSSTNDTKYNPDFATDSGSTLRVTSGAGIYRSLHVGATLSGDGFFVGKKANDDTAKFSVIGATGNTSIVGTLGVAGITSITNSTDSSATNNGALVITGGVGIGAQLRVAGATTVGSSLNVSGNTTLTGDLAVNGGDITTNQSSFNLINATATTVNFAGSASTLTIGSTSGTCTIRNANTVITGNLTVNGTTTTVNATTITVDDPVLTLGGDTAPASDDNKDRGIEFRYFDVSAKLGFFGWDDSASGYRLLENATNTSEVFSGTDARIYAGRLNLSTGTTSTNTTSGALIVTGGAGISENLNVGGTASITSTLGVTGNTTLSGTLGVTLGTTLSSTLGVTGITTLTGLLNANGGIAVSTTAFTVSSGTGNTSIAGTLNVTSQTTLTGLLDANGGAEIDNIRLGIATNNTIDTSTGNLVLDSNSGTTNINDILTVSGATTLSSTLGVTGVTTLSSTLGVTGLITANAGITIVGSTVAGEDFTITNGSSTKFTVGSADGNILTEGNLTVRGSTIIGNAVGDTLTVNAATTFNNADITGTIRDARNWTTARTLSFTGDATGSMSVDGSANSSAALTLATVASAGTYRSVTINAKGLVTSGTNPTTLVGYGLTDAQPLDSDLTAVAGLTTTGLIARTATGTATTRSVTVSGTGLSVTNGDGILGDIAIASNATANNSNNTIVARNASGNFTANVITASLSGNATTATTLSTGRTISTTGDVTYTSGSFNGSGNVTGVATLSNSGVTAGTYTKVTVDTKGRVTVGATASTSDITEGTNLFFTDERAQDAAAAALVTNATHSGVSVAYNDAGNAINISRSALTYSTTNYSGDETTTSFLASAGRSVDNIFVIVDGLIKTPTVEYTYFDSTTLSNVILVSGQNTITVTSNAGLTVSQPVSGTGIGTGAVITLISGTTITVSVPNTLTTTTTATFEPIVKFSTAPTTGTNNVSLRYLPL